MKLSITHHTHYFYSEPVFLQGHLLRFMPRDSRYQQVDSFSLTVTPEAIKQFSVQGIDGSLAKHLDFNQSVSEFSILAHSVVQTQPPPLDPPSLVLPLRYSPAETAMLGPFLEPLMDQFLLKKFAEEWVVLSKYKALPFLDKLTQVLSQMIEKEYREFGWPYPPDETFKLRKGSCRDTAMLWIALVRYVGIAARFVSGYIYDETRADDSELHAWGEAYIPGVGWIGYDPSYGLHASERHVEICAASVPELCAPIEGSFKGNARTRLNTRVGIQLLDS